MCSPTVYSIIFASHPLITQVCLRPRGPRRNRPGGRCATCSATACTSTSGAVGGLRIRTSNSLGISPTQRARLCPSCGYGHFGDEADHEKCVNCGAGLDGGMPVLRELYRIDQVSTRRAD